MEFAEIDRLAVNAIIEVATITALVTLFFVAALYTYSHRDKRRRINVQATSPELSPAMLVIKVSNPGPRTLTVSRPGIELPDGRTIVFPHSQSEVQFPHELHEGKGFTVWTPRSDLAKQLKELNFSGKVKLIGFCQDAVGTVRKGEPWEFDVEARD